jgi:hypothetical protein
MSMKVWKLRPLRLAGMVSLLAALLAVAGDEILQYSPQGYNPLAINLNLPFWRLLTGEMLGVLGIPLCLVGYWCVFRALRLSGAKGMRVLFWLTAFSLAMGVVSHAIVSSAIVVMNAGLSPAPTNVTNELQTSAFIPGALFLLGYLIASIWYCAIVLSRHTPYPRWTTLMNPFLLSLLIAFLYASGILPTAENVLYPAWLSLPHLIFFTVSTLILWRFNEPEDSMHMY